VRDPTGKLLVLLMFSLPLNNNNDFEEGLIKLILIVDFEDLGPNVNLWRKFIC
jgi:hypothetical protein